jgi:hypothetical protein
VRKAVFRIEGSKYRCKGWGEKIEEEYNRRGEKKVILFHG